MKFLFATTEVDKVPLTVLSRTQRFDLRRIPAEKLAAHFAEVAKAEGVEVEQDALRMIARAAKETPVRRFERSTTRPYRSDRGARG